jgi:hypothetical protein
MPTKFFFPWLSLEQPLDIGPIRLVPYERGIKPVDSSGGTLQLDAILGNYGDPSTSFQGGHPQPVGRATLVEWIGDDVELELSDEDIAERLNVGQFVTFSALACRHYANHMSYCNADDLHFVAQRFDPARPGALSMSTRRRDGSTHNFISKQGGVPIFLRPHHAQATRVELDILFIEALLKVEEPDLREKLLSSISVFNRANTDANGFPQASEVTLMRVAFETLLGAGHATKAIHAELAKHFAGELPDPAAWGDGVYSESVWRCTYPDFTKRPLDAWIQDFCAVRNRSSHGKNPKSKHPAPVWSIHNHLLLSSWLFPLMVKKILAENGLYQMSDLDKDRRAGFEEFLAHDVLAEEADGRLYWNLVEDSLRMGELGRALRKAAAQGGMFQEW